MLTLNPYGLPLFGPNVDVYGYGTSIGQLDDTDANAGTFLGTLVLPPNLGYGEDAFFDVTAFVANTHAPFLAFNLRSVGTDVFSSLEFNYGHPSQLLITTAVPEPAPIALLLIGLLLWRHRTPSLHQSPPFSIVLLRNLRGIIHGYLHRSHEFHGSGIRNVKDSTKRADAVKLAANWGTAKGFFWTLGSYDVVAIFEAPDDASMTALGLAIGAGGNVRTQTLRAFSREEMNGILAKLA